MSVKGEGVDSPLLKAARELAPLVRASADRIEHERRLPPTLVESMADAGLFRMAVPASVGGGETDVITFARVLEEIGKADASTGWCLGQGAGTGLVACHLAPEIAQAVFGEPRAITAWGPGSGTFIETSKGYRLSGRWSFASGCRHATWLGGIASRADSSGQPILGTGGRPERWRLLFPASQARIVDIWDVSGLRGTASDAFEVDDLFVPHGFAYGCDSVGHPLPEPRYQPGKLYSFPVLYPIGFASVALGIARSTLDAFVELARAKTPRGGRNVLNQSAVIQSQFARAEANLRAAKLLLHHAAQSAWNDACADQLISTKHRVHIRLASTHAIHSAADAVDTAYRAAGATAIFVNQPFERRFRDIHALTQQVQGSQIHFEAAGQFLLGLPPDMTWM